MFDLIFLITLFLFIGISILSIFSCKSENDGFIKTTRYLFMISVLLFLGLGIFKFIFSYNESFIGIASSIWGYFYLFILIIIIITLYIYLNVWHSQFNSYIAIISPFISIMMLISMPFIDSSRKISFNPASNSFFSYILPVHIIVSLTGEILFFFSFTGSVLYLIMERQLRNKTSMKLINKMPNLESINKFNNWFISRSLIFISLGIITGIVMDYITYNTLSLGSAKEFHIYFSWMVIFCLYFLRYNFNLTSRKVSIINILLFFLIMFLFVFTNVFITKGFHSFT